MVIELSNRDRLNHLGNLGGGQGEQYVEKFYPDEVGLNTAKVLRLEPFVHPVIRRYRKNDEVEVLQLSQKYASWDSTPTEADIQGFHSSEPDFFLVAELNQK